MECFENLSFLSYHFIIFLYGIILLAPLVIISCIKKQPKKEGGVKSSPKRASSSHGLEREIGLYQNPCTPDNGAINRVVYMLLVGIKCVDCVGCSKSISKSIETFEDLDDEMKKMIKPKNEYKKLLVSCFLSSKEINNLLKEFQNAKNNKIEAIETPPNKPILGNIYIYRTDDEVTGIDRNIGIKTSDSLSIKNVVEDNSILANIIRNGPRPFDYDFNDLANILKKATEIVSKEPTLVECSIPCAVYGDIHGQYSDLFRWFQINGWPSKTKSIFLGDYVDRGIYGIEVVGLLCALKIKFPNNIYLIRGNHEEERLNKNYEFYHEVLLKFGKKKGEKMFKLFSEFFSYLPLSCLIGKKVLCMHGGLSPKLTSLNSIRNIKRPIKLFVNETLACDLVWSDPVNSIRDPEYVPNFRRDCNNGVGQLFSVKAIEKTIKKLNIHLIIRAHQVPLKGITSIASGKLLTIFSAPGYQGDNAFNINWGASLSINKDFIITINKIRVTRKCRMNRIKVINARNAFKNKLLLT